MSKKKSDDPILSQTESALAELAGPGSGILLAVSGGSDSTGLMHLAALAAPKLGLKLKVGFVNHGLRTGVDKELHSVRKKADKLGIEVHDVTIPQEEVKKAHTQASIQAWAREMRYRLLEDIARRLELDFIATGHTIDDQAETVLLRIIRGTGLDGMGGIAGSRRLPGGTTVIRPLLKISRIEIRDWLTKRGLDWVDDPSNLNDKYSRVRVRRELLPIMSSMQTGVAKRIAALALDAKNTISFFEGYFSDHENILKKLKLCSGVKVDYKVFESLPDYIRNRIIRFAILQVRSDLTRLERVHIEPIQKLIQEKKSSGALPLPGEAKVYLDRGSLYAFPSSLPERPLRGQKAVPIGKGVWRADFEALGASVEIRSKEPARVKSLELRTRRPGDRIWKSKNKVKELLLEKEIPRIYRDFVPMLARGDKIVSMPLFLKNKDSKIEVDWQIDSNSPLMDIMLDPQHS